MIDSIATRACARLRSAVLVRAEAGRSTIKKHCTTTLVQASQPLISGSCISRTGNTHNHRRFMMSAGIDSDVYATVRRGECSIGRLSAHCLRQHVLTRERLPDITCDTQSIHASRPVDRPSRASVTDLERLSCTLQAVPQQCPPASHLSVSMSLQEGSFTNARHVSELTGDSARCCLGVCKTVFRVFSMRKSSTTRSYQRHPAANQRCARRYAALRVNGFWRAGGRSCSP